VDSIEHLHVGISFEDGRFTITQQVGSTADDVIEIVITADQARPGSPKLELFSLGGEGYLGPSPALELASAL
jgi:hypothetical protein